MASPNYQSTSFPALTRRISVQLANLGRGLACSVTTSWTQRQQEQSGVHSTSYSTETFQRREYGGCGLDATNPEDSSCAAETRQAEGEVSQGKSLSQTHRRRTVTGYARHAALVIVFLMICVALAVLIAYRMTFGSDEMFASTRGSGGEAYPNIVVPKLREDTESLSEFRKWIRELLDQVQETPRNYSVPDETYEGTVMATQEVSSVTVNETTSIATAEEAFNSTLDETLMTAGEAYNSTLGETLITAGEAFNSTLNETLITAGNETINTTAGIGG